MSTTSALDDSAKVLNASNPEDSCTRNVYTDISKDTIEDTQIHESTILASQGKSESTTNGIDTSPQTHSDPEKQRERVLRTMWQRATRQYLDWREENLRLLLKVISILTPEQMDALRCMLQSRNLPRSTVNAPPSTSSANTVLADSVSVVGYGSPTYNQRLQRFLGLQRITRRDSTLSLDDALSRNSQRAASPSKSLSGVKMTSTNHVVSYRRMVRLKLHRSLSDERLCTCDWHHGGLIEPTTHFQCENDFPNDRKDDSEINSLNLTEEDILALFDLPTTESFSSPKVEERPSILSSSSYNSSASRTQGPVMVPPGQRVVSEREWTRLQLEVEDARRKLKEVSKSGIVMDAGMDSNSDKKTQSSKGKQRHCEMCLNYEDQLQTLQETYQEANKRFSTTQAQLLEARQQISSSMEMQGELENRLKTRCSAHAEKIRHLDTRMEEMWQTIQKAHQHWSQSTMKLKEVFVNLDKDRKQSQSECKEMERRYSALMHIHDRVRASELLDEKIQLPEKHEELEHYALTVREKMIDFMAAKEHLEERLRLETLALREQINTIRQNFQTSHDALQKKCTELQEKVTSSERGRVEMENQIAFCRSHHANADKLAQENLDYRKKCQSLQVDLENSESVQRDFVQLSQRLQMQLEQFRQQESSEVRWQHEEDVHSCNECQSSFISPPSMFSVSGINNKKKLHCRHCGRIFCADCLNKTVYSGPAKRPARVCSVCHTMLVKDAVPYFSLQAPNSDYKTREHHSGSITTRNTSHSSPPHLLSSSHSQPPL